MRATTVGRLNLDKFSKCLNKFGRPDSNASRSSVPRSLGSAFPCNFKALTVATTTANVQGTNPSNGDIQTEGSTVIVQPIARRSNGGNGDSGSTVVGASAETNIRG